MSASLIETVELVPGFRKPPVTYEGRRDSLRGGWVLYGPDGTEVGARTYPRWVDARQAAVSHLARTNGSTRARGAQYVRWVAKRNRRTGAEIQLLDLWHEDSPFRDVAAQRWGTACVTHGTLVEYRAAVHARASTSNPAKWCKGCAEQIR